MEKGKAGGGWGDRVTGPDFAPGRGRGSVEPLPCTHARVPMDAEQGGWLLGLWPALEGWAVLALSEPRPQLPGLGPPDTPWGLIEDGLSVKSRDQMRVTEAQPPWRGGELSGPSTRTSFLPAPPRHLH